MAQRTTRAGALTVVRYDAVAEDGPVWTTHAGVLWRGLTTVGRGHAEDPYLGGVPSDVDAVEVVVAADFAHRYSAASGIWNPVHTDSDAARAAGLDAPILHGSATMGLALAALQHHLGEGHLARVAVRFLATVPLPEVLTVSIAGSGQVLLAEVRRSDASPVARLRATYHPDERGEHQ